MVRVKKRLSKRVSTKQREKIKKKVSEHHRKARRAAKKDPTWRSKKKADPGIPNSYPYKEQLLKELEERKDRERQEQADAVEARRALRRGEKRKAEQESSEDEAETEAGVTRIKVGGAQSLADAELAESILRAKAIAETGVSGDSPAEQEVATPLLFRGTLSDLKRATIQDASPRVRALLITLDAREPAAWRVPTLEAFEDVPKVLVLTKTDLVPIENAAAWQVALSHQTNYAVFATASPAKQSPAGIAPLAEHVASLLDQVATESTEDEGELRDAVVVAGLENSGRSSMAQHLAVALDLALPSSTKQSFALYDTPAIVSANSKLANLSNAEEEALEAEEEREESQVMEADEETELDRIRDEKAARRILLRNVGQLQKIKEPLPLIYALLRHTHSLTDLMLAYNIPAFGSFMSGSTNTPGGSKALSEKAQRDADEFLLEVAKSQGRNKKGSVPDTVAAARNVLRDWSDGSIAYYRTPPRSITSDPVLSKAIEAGSIKLVELLGETASRLKEWRKGLNGRARELRLKDDASDSMLDGLVALAAAPLEDEEESDASEDEEDSAEGEEWDDEDDDDDEDDEDDEEADEDDEEAEDQDEEVDIDEDDADARSDEVKQLAHAKEAPRSILKKRSTVVQSKPNAKTARVVESRAAQTSKGAVSKAVGKNVPKAALGEQSKKRAAPIATAADDVFNPLSKRAKRLAKKAKKAVQAGK
ncbi:GTPase [Ceraceosorus bombacis]|uniref:GTPase n=1 Tax=Ceraceosorus bombacis TaxID=401625 RepID=A0A0P1BAH4_9BASI|nr:GTPase [Ceraceosorus bombacis]